MATRSKMPSPNPATLPLPLSPDPNPELSPAAVPFALPVPDSHPTAAEDVEHLITELRVSLTSSQTLLSTQATRLSSLVDVETENSRLKDQYAFLSAAKEAVEAQLQEEVKKRELAEENVEMLRGQVEQARRGVMQLQKQDKERKRMSVISGMSGGGIGPGSLGLGLGEEEVLSNEAAQRESKLVKRQSILGARSHRRASSQSEPSDTLASFAGPTATSPNPQAATLRPVVGGLRELRLGHTPPPNNSTASLSPGLTTATNNPHQSGFFDDQPTTLDKRSLTDSPPGKEDNQTKEELLKLRTELQATQAQLIESEEARVASETCLKALREYMAGQGGGGEGEEGDMSASTAELLKGIRLPPLPTDRDHDENEVEVDPKASAAAAEKAKPSGWAFKLWANKAQATFPGPGASPTLSTAVEPPLTPQTALSRSRAGSTATTTTPKISPLPTPIDEGGNTLTPSASSSTVTPLSSFVSNWTRNVSPGQPSLPPASTTATNESSKPVHPGTTRKLSVTSFFSRPGAGGAGGKRGSQIDIGKELPTPPELAAEDDSEILNESIDLTHSDIEFESSATINQNGFAGLPGRVERDKRKSQGTTITDLEDELGTPEISLKEIQEVGLVEAEDAEEKGAKV